VIIAHNEDPSRFVEAAFNRIQRESMADVPILNPVLRVEAIGFMRWRGRWLGVLVTPWCMNLMLLADAPANWTSIAAHERLFYHFPAGDFAFLCGEQPELGEYHSCALYSPMAQFQDQDSARAVASAALAALMSAPPPGLEIKSAEGGMEPQTSAIDSLPLQPEREMSKREFFGKIFPRLPP